jgi:GMP synthase (glutamine-hydrolysing)
MIGLTASALNKMNLDADKILILDFGSQYTQLIARRIRENHVYCKILSCDTPFKMIREFKPKGLILSGGPASVYNDKPPRCSHEMLDLGIPLLGICYGMQWLTHELGGKVAPATRREYGKAGLFIDDPSDLLRDIGVPSGAQRTTTVWMSHGDRIERMPGGFQVIAHTQNSPIAAMKHETRPLYALQFHPEVIHTREGISILKNFLFRICHVNPTWTMVAYLEKAVEEIRETVQQGKVICALSGGVDSTVAAVLVQRAIGDRLTCIFVDNGLLRHHEAEQVVETFRKELKMNLRYVDASSGFLKKLKGVTDPEQKRRIIGRQFIKTFEQEAKSLGHPEFLIQGTLYPDWIESTSFRGPSAKIKTHHNVGGLPTRMRFRLIEPLKELFKDEVRRLGAELHIPDKILHRHPFPGPGLAVRIIGEVNRKRLELLREADVIAVEEIKKAGLYPHLWQVFCVLLPIKTVGVMGDERTYEHVVALRAVESADGMTADWARLSHEVLEVISNRIISEARGINRVVYDITSKPPGTIEWE